jgi:hypothetical protein
MFRKLDLFLSSGVSHPLTRGPKQIQFPKLRVLQNTGRWAKSNNPVILSVIHHHQNLQNLLNKIPTVH